MKRSSFFKDRFILLQTWDFLANYVYDPLGTILYCDSDDLNFIIKDDLNDDLDYNYDLHDLNYNQTILTF